MKTREEILLQHPFFTDKPSLAEQIITIEKKGSGFLPNSFTFKTLEPGDLPEKFNKKLTLGRIHTFYFISFGSNPNDARYQCFENKSKLITFLVNQASKVPANENEDPEQSRKQIVTYWLNKIEKLN